MIELLRNHLVRAWGKKMRLFIMIGLIVVALGVALFLSDRTSASLKIAVVGNPTIQLEENSLEITSLEKQPAKSELALGAYDAVVDFSQGVPQITTFKNNDFKKQLAALLAGKSGGAVQSAAQMNKAQRILGYVLMFLLMAGVTNTFLFSEDKEKHLMERMICSGLSQEKLFLSYFIFLFTLLFIPTFMIFTIFNQVFHVDLGMSLGNYACLLALLCLVGVSFALCNASFFKDGDQANMIGSMLLVITSLVSGSFFSLADDTGWWKTVTNYLPQKQFLQLTEEISKGQSYQENSMKIVFLVVLSSVFLLIAIKKNQKQYLQ
ncbi:ABC transporter permease [Candidatus Enterococcus ferrettii]|uniref:ABC-2 type transporter transmembrane domain-containing protein n=1 Tax=Candidatus Enterococcus ferrettii TaxID=2815324 RepID=A0ABV0EM41_9ENTE|nr:ABC transporter permease [Enterococcus sp. 665A]MBO1341442.1 ABC transporter permease [Enterococcus sp. 665A]